MGVPFSMVPNSEDILTFLNCPLIWEYFISEFTLIATSFKFGTRDQKYFAAENWKTTFLTYIGSKYKLIGPFFLTRLLQQYSWRWTRALAPHLQFTTKFMAHNITFFQTQSSYCLKSILCISLNDLDSVPFEMTTLQFSCCSPIEMDLVFGYPKVGPHSWAKNLKKCAI